jgi:hypothetical protein
MRFAKLLFLFSGIYGLLVILPLFFMEAKTGVDYPPPINHPEYYYGFAGVALAWQVLFLVLSKDPVRYRPMIIPAIIEKAVFGIAVIVLFLQHRVATLTLGFAIIDLLLGSLFAIAFIRLGDAARGWQSDRPSQSPQNP